VLVDRRCVTVSPLQSPLCPSVCLSVCLSVRLHASLVVMHQLIAIHCPAAIAPFCLDSLCLTSSHRMSHEHAIVCTRPRSNVAPPQSAAYNYHLTSARRPFDSLWKSLRSQWGNPPLSAVTSPHCSRPRTQLSRRSIVAQSSNRSRIAVES